MMDTSYNYEDLDEFLVKTSTKMKPIFEMGKAGGVTVDDIKKKAGTKDDMSEIIYSLLSCVNKSTEWIKKLHGYNFSLQNKLLQTSTDAITQIQTSQKEIYSKIDNLKLEETSQQIKTYASVIGKASKESNSNKFDMVGPIKKALVEVQDQENRENNVIIVGLDINPDEEDKKKDLISQAMNVVYEIGDGNLKASDLQLDEESVTFLGDVQQTGKAPPLKVNVRNKHYRTYILKNSARLKTSRLKEYHGVFVYRDLTREQLKESQEIRQKLKIKIREEPNVHWVIKDGQVVSRGGHEHRQKTSESFADRSFSYQY